MSQTLKVLVLLFFVALVQGYPSERKLTLDHEKPTAAKKVTYYTPSLLLPWKLPSEIEEDQPQRPAPREPTEFERTKEANELVDRKPIVWRFNSLNQIEIEDLFDQKRNVEIDNGQIRCLSLQCLRIIFKTEPLLANCECPGLGFLMLRLVSFNLKF